MFFRPKLDRWRERSIQPNSRELIQPEKSLFPVSRLKLAPIAKINNGSGTTPDPSLNTQLFKSIGYCLVKVPATLSTQANCSLSLTRNR